MKFFRNAYIILSLMLFTGCDDWVYDDLSKCPPGADNVTLLFSRMIAGSDEFRNNVLSVDVVVYDENGEFVMRKSVPQADLAGFSAAQAAGKSGTFLTLDPGTYRIVCWGNAGGNTIYQNLAASKTLADAALQHSCYDAGVGETYDPLYYAPGMDNIATPETFTITVPQHGTTEKTIDFTAAHNTVEVYVKGLAVLPEVEITSMSWAYDFLMRTKNDRPLCFVQNTKNITYKGDTYAGAQFHTAQFSNENTILIHIKSAADHSILYTVNMREFLADNNITLDETDHDLIQILVTFIGADVKVTVPSWVDEPVKPTF